MNTSTALELPRYIVFFVIHFPVGCFKLGRHRPVLKDGANESQPMQCIDKAKLMCTLCNRLYRNLRWCHVRNLTTAAHRSTDMAMRPLEVRVEAEVGIDAAGTTLTCARLKQVRN